MATKAKKGKVQGGEPRPNEHYRICESILTFDVEECVNKLMDKGWKPLGNLIALHYEEEGREYTKFIQAMVKDSAPR
jgi:hypothetical protein